MTSVRDPGRPVRVIRASRVIMALVIAWNVALGTANALAGDAVAFVSLALVLVLVGAVAFLTFVIRHVEATSGRRYPLSEPVARKIAHRPRKVMTPADYERTRELERELGWEPSEPCMPAKAADARAAARDVKASVKERRRLAQLKQDARAFGRVVSAERSALKDAQSAQRAITADMAKFSEREAIAEASAVITQVTADVFGDRASRFVQHRLRVPDGGAEEHFAALARIHLYRCISPCPLCDARDRSAEALEALAGELEARRRGEAQAARGFTPADIALMRAITWFGKEPVMLPSGRTLTGDEFKRWQEQDRAQRWLDEERWGGTS